MNYFIIGGQIHYLLHCGIDMNIATMAVNVGENAFQERLYFTSARFFRPLIKCVNDFISSCKSLCFYFDVNQS